MKRRASAEQDSLHDQQEGNDATLKEHRGRRTRLLAHARIGRHEGRVERALAKDGAKMIGQLERDDEGIRHRSGAEDRRHDDVADEAGRPGHQRPGADGQDLLQQDGRPDAIIARSYTGGRASRRGADGVAPEKKEAAAFAAAQV